MNRISTVINHLQKNEQVLKPLMFRGSGMRYAAAFLSNKRYRSGKGEYLQDSIIPTMHFQPSLPRLPIPKLEDTCRRYLDAQKPLLTPEEYEKTKKITENFLGYEGRGPWYDMYLKYRPSIVLNHNPFIMLNDDPTTTDQLVRATKIIHTAVRFKNSLEANLLEPDVYHLNPKKSDTKFFRQLTRLIPSNFSWYAAYLMKAYPLDMSQYVRLFNTSRIPQKERDELRTHKEDNHILVLRNGHFFVFDIVRDGALLPKDEIHQNLCQIMKESEEPAEYSLGVFTAENRDLWATLRGSLESDSKTAESLRKIDGALFAICLDDVDLRDEFHAARVFLHGDGKNRWYDKSFSILLANEAKVAINFEHAWGDGVAVLRFLTEVQVETTKDSYTPSDVSYGDGVSKLEFNLSDSMKEQIKKSQETFDQHVSRLSLNAFKIEDFDKNYIKKKKLSPDAVMQLAFQMAYYRMFGTSVPTYESCATAAFKHGRTETIRPATVATVACSEAFEKSHSAGVEEMNELLQKSSEYHGKLTKEAALGQGFDRHLFGMRHMAERSGKKVPFFQDPSYQNINHIIMSTSTVFSPHVQLGGFAPVVPNGLGVGYMVGEDYLGCNVSSYPDSPSGAQFVELVRESLLDIYSVLEGRNFKS